MGVRRSIVGLGLAVVDRSAEEMKRAIKEEVKNKN